MGTTMTMGDVLERTPKLFERVWREPVDSRPALTRALTSLGFLGGPHDGAGAGRRERSDAYLLTAVRVEGVEPGTEHEAERRLRTALSLRVGRAVGTDKHWDLGSFRVRVSLAGGRLRLSFTGQPSIALARAVAKDWLAGVDGHEVARRHGLVDDGAEPNERGYLPAPTWMAVSTLAHQDASGRCDRIAFTTAPGTVPPGVLARTDDEAYSRTRDYLAEGLGPWDDRGEFLHPRWTRGGRRFDFRRMASRSRTITFDEPRP